MKPHSDTDLPSFAANSVRRAVMQVLAAVAICIGVAFPAVQPAAANLLANGNMETGGDGPLQGWTAYRWEGQGSIETTRAVAFEGQQSVVINGSGPSKQAIFQRLELPPCTYRLTAAVAAFGAVPNQWKLSGTVHVAFNGGRSITHSFGSGDSDWRRLDLRFSVAAGEQPATLYFFNYGGGRVFVDDAKLEAVAGCVSEPDKFTLSVSAAKSLGFVAPITEEDRVLEGYCQRADFSRGAVCRRLQTAPTKTTPATERSGPLVIADFETSNPFEAGTTIKDKAIGGSRSAVVRAGSYITARNVRGLESDWSGYDWLRFDVENPTDKAQKLLVELWDDKTTGYWSRVNWYSWAAPGRSTIEVPLQTFVGEKSTIGERRRIDLKEMRTLAVSDVKTELTVDNFRLETEPKPKAVFPELIALDAGTGDSPVMNGFTRFIASTVYRPERGWGLIPGSVVARSEDRRHPDNLYRDWVSFTGGGLQFDLPNGEYTVWMMIEDPGYWSYYPFWRTRSVFVQEQEVLNERTSIPDLLGRYLRHASDEDWPGDNIWARYVKQRYQPKVFKAAVTNGRLTVRFKSENDPYATALSALVVYPSARAKEGADFLAELDARLATQFNAEYRQFQMPASRDPLPPANALGGKLWTFNRAVTTEIFGSDRPGPAELASGLSVALARGHIEPITVGLHTSEHLDLIAATLAVPGLEVTPYSVRYRVKRMTEDGSIYASWPRTLDPLAISPAAPLRLKAGTSRRLWFDVKATAAARPGIIAGKLTLEFAGGLIHTMPVKAELYPWTLPVADAPFGYLGVAPTYPSVRFPEILERRTAEMQKSVDLLGDWSMTAASGGLSPLRFQAYRDGKPLIDYTDADTSMAAIRRRFQGEVLTYDGFNFDGGIQAYAPRDTRGSFARPYERVVKDALDAIAEHGAANQWLPLMHVVGDEPSGAEAVKNSIAVAQAIRSARPSARTAVFTSFTKTDEPTAAMAGKIDRLYVGGHSEAALTHIKAFGSECSLYNRTTRFDRGVYPFKLKRLGCRGHMMFAFSSVHADPWYGLDGREDEWVAVLSHPDGKLRPALDFARFRIAVDDYRTLQAVEQAIAAAASGPARAAAAAWLEAIDRRTTVGHEATRPWADDQLDGLRREAAQHLHALGYRGPTAARAPSADRKLTP